MKLLLIFAALAVFLAPSAHADEGSLADIVSGMDFSIPAEEAVVSDYYTVEDTDAGAIHRITVEYGEDGGFVRAAWLTVEGEPVRETVAFEIRTGYDGRDPAGQDTADAVSLALAEAEKVYNAMYNEELTAIFTLLLPSYAGDARLDDEFLTVMHDASDSWLAKNEWTCVLITDEQIEGMLGMGGVLLLELEDGSLEANTRGGNAAVALQRLDELPEEYLVPGEE